MYGTWTTLAALALAMTANCHMIMLTPTPFNNETIDNSPLDTSGTNFPCKSTGQPDFYNANGIKNTMAIGEPQTLSFRGSAVHGGGSCQLAITTDKAPTASSTWSVIQSIEGGCPSTDGTAPSTYKYSIPDGVPPGDYVFAWTWVSKESGGPEYYMNCAPITVTGGSSKLKDRRHNYKRDSLPNLAVFNLASVNQCKSTLSSDPTYADPGPNLVKPAGTRNYQPISGTNCFPKGGSAAGGLSGAGGSSNSSSGAGSAGGSAPASSGAPPAATSAVVGAGAGTGAGASPSSPAAAGTPSGAGAAGEASTPSSRSSSVVATPVTSGGVTAGATLSFPEITPTASTAVAAGAGSAAGVSAAATPTTPPTSSGGSGSSGSGSGSSGSGAGGSGDGGAGSGAGGEGGAGTGSGGEGGSGSAGSGSGAAGSGAASPTAAASGVSATDPAGASPSASAVASPAASTAVSPAASPSPASSPGASSGGTGGGLTGPCTNEGIYNCIGGKSFQRCASGLWSAVLAMPAGTSCTPGQSQGLWARTWEHARHRYRRRFHA